MSRFVQSCDMAEIVGAATCRTIMNLPDRQVVGQVVRQVAVSTVLHKNLGRNLC